jgi:hypothetical protein
MASVPRNAQVFTYTPAERQALRQLRQRYQRKEEVWSPGELAHLRFVRWLYLTRRLLP